MESRPLMSFFYRLVGKKDEAWLYVKCKYNVFMIEFEWDVSKVASNKRKHGVTFDEAQSVF